MASTCPCTRKPPMNLADGLVALSILLTKPCDPGMLRFSKSSRLRWNHETHHGDHSTGEVRRRAGSLRELRRPRTYRERSQWLRQAARTHRGLPWAEYVVDLLPKIRIEVLATDDQVDDIVDVLISSSNTGRAGDGKVWTVSVHEAVRVRTGERGNAAV